MYWYIRQLSFFAIIFKLWLSNNLTENMSYWHFTGNIYTESNVSVVGQYQPIYSAPIITVGSLHFRCHWDSLLPGEFWADHSQCSPLSWKLFSAQLSTNGLISNVRPLLCWKIYLPWGKERGKLCHLITVCLSNRCHWRAELTNGWKPCSQPELLSTHMTNTRECGKTEGIGFHINVL